MPPLQPFLRIGTSGVLSLINICRHLTPSSVIIVASIWSPITCCTLAFIASTPVMPDVDICLSLIQNVSPSLKLYCEWSVATAPEPAVLAPSFPGIHVLLEHNLIFGFMQYLFNSTSIDAWLPPAISGWYKPVIVFFNNLIVINLALGFSGFD